MKPTFKGQRCSKGLPLRAVLSAWCGLNERIAKEWGIDVPWWYNERASLSIFAGAISSTGHFAFEEFSNEKRKVSPKAAKGHLSYNGRVDLYFCVRRKDFMAEAKMCWPRCGRLHPTRQRRIEESLALACKDIAISAPHGQRRLGMVFVAPRWRRSLKREIDARIEAWISKIAGVKCDAVAWIFPKATRTTHSSDFLYPGVAVLIKEVKRWRSPTRRQSQRPSPSRLVLS